MTSGIRASSRDRVAAELDQYLQAAGFADPWSDDAGSSTRWLYTDDGVLYTADRLEYHATLIEAELASRTGVSARGSLGIVVTAGPPGAGKSTALAGEPALKTYRDVDADSFKDALLIETLATNRNALLNHLMHILGDEKPIALRELATYVHAESTTIANRFRDTCLERGENIIVHGTLSSAQQTEELLSQLGQYNYSSLVIVDVETTEDRAIEQAMGRWWSDRQNNSDGRGGRFVSPSTISRQFTPGRSESNCAANAELLRARAEDLGWAVKLQKIS